MENASCSDLKSVLADEPNLTACVFVTDVSSCSFDSGFLPYNHFLYCSFSSVAGPVIILILWLLFLLIGLATTADCFFGPNLIVVTRLTRMSQNLAGVTLLAFGNGAADIFSAISAVSSMEEGDAGLAFGSLFGAGVLVNSVTAGAIMIITPFQCMRRPIIKDLVFYIIAVIWTVTILVKGYIHIGESIGFIGLYIVYVIFTVVSRMIYTRHEGKEIDIDEIVEIEETDENGEVKKRKVSKKDAVQYDPKTGVVLKSYAGKEGEDNPAYVPDSAGAPKGILKGAKGRFQDMDEVAEEETSRPRRPSRISQVSDVSVGGTRRRKITRGFNRNPAYISHWVMAHKPMDEYRLAGDDEEFTFDADLRRRSVSDIIAPRIATHKISVEQRRPRAISTAFRTDQVGADDHRYQRKPKFTPPSWKDRWDIHRARSTSTAEPPHKKNEPKEDFDKVSLGSKDEEKEEVTEEEEEEYIFPGQWQQLAYFLCPFSLQEFKEMSLLSKFLEIFRSPIMLWLKLTVPVVDEDHPIHAWCRPINCFHCFFTLLFVVFALKFGVHLIAHSLPVSVLILILGLIISLVVWFTSKPESPPVYHGVYAFVGFIVSIIWIYSIANEIVNILTTLGIVFNLSDAILGLTLLAWANSVGDMMSNLVLAKSNFPRIAFTACIGGPLLNLLMGIGIPFTIRCITKGKSFIPVQLSSVLIVLLAFLLICLTCHLVVIPLLRFKLKAPFGIALIIIYIVFFIIAILCETKVIVLI